MLRARDEREQTVDSAADRFSYQVLAFGLLLAVIWRGAALGEASWDLLALVVVSGVAGVGYRLVHRAVGPTWFATLAVVVGAAALTAAVLTVFIRP